MSVLHRLVETPDVNQLFFDCLTFSECIQLSNIDKTLEQFGWNTQTTRLRLTTWHEIHTLFCLSAGNPFPKLERLCLEEENTFSDVSEKKIQERWTLFLNKEQFPRLHTLHLSNLKHMLGLAHMPGVALQTLSIRDCCLLDTLMVDVSCLRTFVATRMPASLSCLVATRSLTHLSLPDVSVRFLNSADYLWPNLTRLCATIQTNVFFREPDVLFFDLPYLTHLELEQQDTGGERQLCIPCTLVNSKQIQECSIKGPMCLSFEDQESVLHFPALERLVLWHDVPSFWNRVCPETSFPSLETLELAGDESVLLERAFRLPPSVRHFLYRVKKENTSKCVVQNELFVHTLTLWAQDVHVSNAPQLERIFLDGTSSFQGACLPNVHTLCLFSSPTHFQNEFVFRVDESWNWGKFVELSLPVIHRHSFLSPSCIRTILQSTHCLHTLHLCFAKRDQCFSTSKLTQILKKLPHLQHLTLSTLRRQRLLLLRNFPSLQTLTLVQCVLGQLKCRRLPYLTQLRAEQISVQQVVFQHLPQCSHIDFACAPHDSDHTTIRFENVPRALFVSLQKDQLTVETTGTCVSSVIQKLVHTNATV